MALKTWVIGEKLNASDLNDNFQKVGSDTDMVIPTFNGTVSGVDVSSITDQTVAIIGRFSLIKSIIVNKVSLYSNGVMFSSLLRDTYHSFNSYYHYFL